MKLSPARRKALPNEAFALPGRRYPIPNLSHAKNALARVSEFGTPAEQATVRAKVYAKFPGIGQKRAAPTVTATGAYRPFSGMSRFRR